LNKTAYNSARHINRKESKEGRLFINGAIDIVHSSHCAVVPLLKPKCLQRPPEFIVR